MDLTAKNDRRDFRLAACATPIAAPGVSDFQTIESAINVAFLNPPMTIGTVTLEDGSTVRGFLVEPAALVGAEEITGFGSWPAAQHARGPASRAVVAASAP